MRLVLYYLKELPWWRLLIFGAIFWALITLFIEIAEEILEGESLLIDNEILNGIRGLTTPILSDLMIAITHTGGFLGVVLITIAVIALLWLHHKRIKAVILALTVAVLALMNLILKLFFARERPDLWPDLVEVSNYSFPSGHAMMSSALGFMIIVLFWKSKWRWVVIIVSVLYVLSVGFSRLYLGVHYPSDVLAGWTISGAWIVLVLVVLRSRKLYKDLIDRELPKNFK